MIIEIRESVIQKKDILKWISDVEWYKFLCTKNKKEAKNLFTTSSDML